MKLKNKTYNSAFYMATYKLHDAVPESYVQSHDCCISGQDAQSVKGILD